jgi:hypothetical protein
MLTFAMGNVAPQFARRILPVIAIGVASDSVWKLGKQPKKPAEKLKVLALHNGGGLRGPIAARPELIAFQFYGLAAC